MKKAQRGRVTNRKLRNSVKAFTKKTLKEKGLWLEPIPSMNWRLDKMDEILGIDTKGEKDMNRIKEIASYIPVTPRKERENNWEEYKAKSQAFYASREWQTARYRVLQKARGECMACGRSRAVHGVVLHIDHIKPRYHHPELELDEGNLQVLCADCNMGKGAWDQTDWR